MSDELMNKLEQAKQAVLEKIKELKARRAELDKTIAEYEEALSPSCKKTHVDDIQSIYRSHGGQPIHAGFALEGKAKMGDLVP